MIKSIGRMLEDNHPRDSYVHKSGLLLQPLLRYDTTSWFCYQLSNYLFYQYSPLGLTLELMLQAYLEEPPCFELVASTWIPSYPSDFSIPSQQEQVEVGLPTGAGVDFVGDAVGVDVGTGVDFVGDADGDALGVDVGTGVDFVGDA
eukprot:CAMPEP_0203634242 /NCGR_PEP_ID=MMETSP0088-20131115/1283_1 /ASSEMBLY_ACC=CAM_ASM_001087 /TAXON_ID=426623 /ORGANISM="Chaetoceros affinis, Strain CCMP159" /LENGTH=145 /DNA_ID=CAMNT_0050487833 /DNA_START=92 /DNA_END=524 /DNA_ORIENTATION=-